MIDAGGREAPGRAWGEALSEERYTERWSIGQWTFYRIEGHGFTDPATKDRPLFGYGPAGATRKDGRPQTGEWYNTLEHAMAAAIAEKYTGARGAGGSGVGTAADWFMRMIGADTLQELNREDSEKALSEAHAGAVEAGAASAEDPRISRQEKHRRKTRQTRWTLDELAARGVVLAAVNHGR